MVGSHIATFSLLWERKEKKEKTGEKVVLEKSGRKNLTPKQEKFCLNIVSGMNPAQAYKEAYNPPNAKDETIRVQANKTLHLPNIFLHIEELRKQQQKEINYTAKDSFNKFNELQKKALENEDLSVATKIEELKGKLVGLYTEKKEVDVGVKAIQVIFDENCKNL